MFSPIESTGHGEGSVLMANADDFIKVEGLAFLEFSGPRPELLRSLFERMGLRQHQHRDDPEITLHNQRDIHFISNPSSGGHTEQFRQQHGRGASSIGFLVEDSNRALEAAITKGATSAETTDYDIPAIVGIGGSLIYLVDRHRLKALFADFGYDPRSPYEGASQLLRVDHLTHNLYPGGISRFRDFYRSLFGFDYVRSFEIEGKKTGLYSEVIASPCGRVIIPMNETRDDKSQIAEYLREYNGEGIQHIALSSVDLVETVDVLNESGVEFQDTPDTYYEMVDERLPGHGEDTELLKQHRILIDGGEKQGGGYLLQIFTKNSIGPIFFEYIERKGNKGFGEGNFQALFESIELDQERRGVL